MPRNTVTKEEFSYLSNTVALLSDDDWESLARVRNRLRESKKRRVSKGQKKTKPEPQPSGAGRI